MNISTLTGTKEPLDNWTALYGFALGIIAGAFIAIGIGDVDVGNDLRGDLLRVYLTLITAIFAGGMGLFVSRLGDRIADRRKRKRAILILLHNIDELAVAITTFQTLVAKRQAEGGGAISSNSQNLHLLMGAERACRAANRDLHFTDVIDDESELDPAIALRELFDHAVGYFRTKPYEDLDEDELAIEASAFVHQTVFANLQEQISELGGIRDFFQKRLVLL